MNKGVIEKGEFGLGRHSVTRSNGAIMQYISTGAGTTNEKKILIRMGDSVP
jgi:hypothetical protein